MQPASVPIAMTVNGQSERLEVRPHHTLLEVLRDQIHLTGTKECCAEGECGACTVLVNGRAVCSCLMLAAEADGGGEDGRHGRDHHTAQRGDPVRVRAGICALVSGSDAAERGDRLADRGRDERHRAIPGGRIHGGV